MSDKVVIETPSIESSISCSTWCTFCYRMNGTKEQATFIFRGDGLCEEHFKIMAGIKNE